MTEVVQIRKPAYASAPEEPEATSHRQLFDAAIVHLLSPDYVSLTPPPHELPEEVLLGALRDGRLRVVEPIRVKFKREDQHVIAEAIEIDEFGFGENASDALADLQRATSELFLALEQEQARLGPDLQRIWDILGRKISKRA